MPSESSSWDGGGSAGASSPSATIVGQQVADHSLPARIHAQRQEDRRLGQRGEDVLGLGSGHGSEIWSAAQALWRLTLAMREQLSTPGGDP
jgi:hypothetical protein